MLCVSHMWPLYGKCLHDIINCFAPGFPHESVILSALTMWIAVMCLQPSIPDLQATFQKQLFRNTPLHTPRVWSSIFIQTFWEKVITKFQFGISVLRGGLSGTEYTNSSQFSHPYITVYKIKSEDDYPTQWYKYGIPYCIIFINTAFSQKTHCLPK